VLQVVFSVHGQETVSNYSQNNSQNRDEGIIVIIPLDIFFEKYDHLINIILQTKRLENSN